MNYSEQLDYQAKISKHNKNFQITIINKSLVIEIFEIEDNTNWSRNYAGFEFGRSANISNPQEIKLPFLYDVPVGLVNNSLFYSAYIDRTKSHSTGQLIKEECSDLTAMAA